MKVAYIYFMLRRNQVGVEMKLRHQARAITSAGLNDLELFVLNPWRQEKVEGVNFVKLRSSVFPLNYFEYVFRRYDLIARSLDLEKYDLIILRYPLADPSGIEFARKYKVVTEHHTKEPLELLSSLSGASSLLEKLAKRVSLFLEERYAAELLEGCQGLIAVSEEIRTFEVERANNSLPSITVANGINVENVPHTRSRQFDGRRLDVAFVASFLRPWHGLDRVIKSFNRYSGPVHWTLHVIGNIGPDSVKSVSGDSKNVKFHGPKAGKELDELMRTMHVAVSTMSYHRNGMKEGCPLKTREYTSRGIPFILAYNDPDLKERSECFQFCLTFENNDSLLDVNEIIDFVRLISRKGDTVSDCMRKYAFEHMDWPVKLRRYLDFVRCLAQETG